MDQLTHFFERIMAPSPTIFITGFLIILLVPILLHLILVRSTPYNTPPQILLLGPSGAGKTALLTRLERGDKASDTHSSQTEATVELSSQKEDSEKKGKKFIVVDTPGHGKLRQSALWHLSAEALAGTRTRGAVFVVDAGAITEQDALAATATYLYDVLIGLQRRAASSRSSTPPPAVPVLVAANKLDLFTALPAALVRTNLEAELGRIRASRSKGLLDSGVGEDEVGSEERDEWLGSYGTEKFAFEQLREFDIEVDVIGGNVLGDGPGVEKWWKWMVERL